MLRITQSIVFFFRRAIRLGLVLLVSVELLGCTNAISESSELREPEVPDEEETSSDEKEEEDLAGQLHIYVHVCGEVRAPGVYELPQGSRVYEAIEAAGGMAEEASPAYLNQAEKLEDGQQIYVPSAQEAESAAAGMQVGPEEDDGKIDLNTASKEELMTLSGIGEVKAEAVIRYREEKGGFTSVEELKEIEGIKDGVFNKVKDQIKVS